MAEVYNNQRFVKNRRGFYVKMKFFPTKNIHHGKHETQQKQQPFLFRYFKWILWFSLSFYFFAKFLNNHETGYNKTTSSFDLKTKMVDHHSHRALSEELVLQQPKHNQGMLNDMKVYIYELPPKYNRDWLSNPRCSNHLFASEVAIHKALMNSDVRTYDPSLADFFFVPVYVSCNFSTVNGFPAIGHARGLLASAVEFISSGLPYWNRSNGSDHVFVASHDYGACFHAMEDRAIANGIPEFMKNSIVLQTFGVKYDHPCQNVENIVIPPYISPKSVQSTLSKAPIDGHRDIFAFFRGKMEVHPKNVSGHFYSKRVRTKILRKYVNNPKFYLKRHRFAGYQSEIVRSVFCLCPLGWAPWSPRLVESVALGCVPVIISNDIRLPFESTVPWSEISLTVRENDVAKLGKILDHVAATNLSTIQRNLWDPKLRRALLFNDDVEAGDATSDVLSSLSRKLSRSYRRMSVSG